MWEPVKAVINTAVNTGLTTVSQSILNAAEKSFLSSDKVIRRKMARLVSKVEITGWKVKILEREGLSDNEIFTLFSGDVGSVLEMEDDTVDQVDKYFRTEFKGLSLSTVADDDKLQYGLFYESRHYQSLENKFVDALLREFPEGSLRDKTQESNPRRDIQENIARGMNRTAANLFGTPSTSNHQGELTTAIHRIYERLGIQIPHRGWEMTTAYEVATKLAVREGKLKYFLSRDNTDLSEFTIWATFKSRSPEKMAGTCYYAEESGFVLKKYSELMDYIATESALEEIENYLKRMEFDARFAEAALIYSIPLALAPRPTMESNQVLSLIGVRLALAALLVQCITKTHDLVEAIKFMGKLLDWVEVIAPNSAAAAVNVEDRGKRMLSTKHTMRNRMIGKIEDNHVLSYCIRDEWARSLSTMNADNGKDLKPGIDLLDTVLAKRKTLSNRIIDKCYEKVRKKELVHVKGEVGLDQIWCYLTFNQWEGEVAKVFGKNLKKDKSVLIDTNDSVIVTDPASRTLFHYYKETCYFDKLGSGHDVQPFVSERDMSAELVMSVLLLSLVPSVTGDGYEVARDVMKSMITKASWGLYAVLDRADELIEDSVRRNAALWKGLTNRKESCLREAYLQYLTPFDEKSRAWITREVLCRLHKAGVACSVPKSGIDKSCFRNAIEGIWRVREVTKLELDIGVPIGGILVEGAGQSRFIALSPRKYLEDVTALGAIMLTKRTSDLWHLTRAHGRVLNVSPAVMEEKAICGFLGFPSLPHTI